MVLHREEFSETASSGAISVTTSESIDGMCRNVLVSPATSTTTWDMTITDGDAFIIFKRTKKAGDLSELIDLPMRGQYTIAIANASVDEVFKITLIIE